VAQAVVRHRRKLGGVSGGASPDIDDGCSNIQDGARISILCEGRHAASHDRRGSRGLLRVDPILLYDGARAGIAAAHHTTPHLNFPLLSLLAQHNQAPTPCSSPQDRHLDRAGPRQTTPAALFRTNGTRPPKQHKLRIHLTPARPPCDQSSQSYSRRISYPEHP
jgi:hypothetical protein